MTDVPATNIDATWRAAILVEGMSDAVAVKVVAQRTGIDLAGAGVGVLPMGGVTNVAKFIARFGPAGLHIPFAVLCDGDRAAHARAAMERAGLDPGSLFVCAADLEYEFIRAIGPAGIESLFDANGDGTLFRTFQNQPAQRERTLERQLHRFLGTTAGRKERYAAILAEAVDLERVPGPVAGVLRFVSGAPPIIDG